jgi:hypothetical protein
LFPTVRLALLRAGRRDPARFRLLQFSVQRDHVHLIVEASDKRALSSGVRSVAILIARYVNELLARRGPLWGDRWHGHTLKSPREVRNALAYVLGNFRKHARRTLPPGVDRYSSGAWFDGWRDFERRSGLAPPFMRRDVAVEPATECPVSNARTWLARVGWRRHGLLRFDETPGGTARVRGSPRATGAGTRRNLRR